MKKKYFYFYLFLGFCMIILSNCGVNRGCDGVDKEPTIILESITKAGQDVYPLIRQISVSNSNKLVGKDSSGNFLMPLDLNNNQTQYFIQLTTGAEYTLTLTYTRKVIYEDSKECGFRVVIDNPKQSIAQSSIGLTYFNYGTTMKIKID